MSSQILVANEIFAAKEVDDDEDANKSIEKYEKLSKTRKLSKSTKLSKSQKLAKLEKKLLKSKNSPSIDAKKNRPSFLIPNVRTIFNYLWLAFIKILIF